MTAAWQRGLEHIVFEQEMLGPKTWLRVGGPAEFFVTPTRADELVEVVRRCREQDIPVRILGGGSNVLVPDEGVPGVVLSLSAPAFMRLDVQGERIVAGGGVPLMHLVATAAREGLAGLEPLAGIPGTVGGGLHGNAGTTNTDLGQWTESVRVLTRSGEVAERPRSDIHFGYRTTSLNELAILEVVFGLERDDPHAVTRRLQKAWIVRRASQPPEDVPCAMAFKTEGGADPGDLIEQAGLRRARVGGAEICDRHPDLVTAHPGCTARDVRELLDLVKTRVKDRTGVELETLLDIW